MRPSPRADERPVLGRNRAGLLSMLVSLARSLGAELPQRTEPVFHVVGLGNLAVLDGLNIDGHDLEALTGVRHAKELAGWRAGDLATHNYAVAGDEYFSDLKLHVGDGFGKISNHLDRRFTTPAFARQIAGARFVVGSKHLLLDGFDIASSSHVEQAVPGCDDGAGLWLGEGF